MQGDAANTRSREHACPLYKADPQLSPVHASVTVHGRWIAEKRRVVSEERRRQRAQRQRSHVAVDVAPAASGDVNELLECVPPTMSPVGAACYQSRHTRDRPP